MRWASTRAAAVVTALLVAIGGFVVQAPAASAAAAAACPNVTAGGGGIQSARIQKSPRAAVHSGPAAKCRVTDYLAYGTTVNKLCSWFNSSTGNWWTYTNWGWIYEGYLDGYNAGPCP